MLKAVIFDMDGVIIDSEHLHLEVDKRVMEVCGVDVPFGYFEKYIGISNPSMWQEVREVFAIDKSVDALMKLQDDLNMTVLMNSNIYAISGIRELLDVLKLKNIKLGIASSSPRSYIEAVIKKFKIRDYFDVYMSGEEVENGKPAPDVYLRVTETIGVLPSECAVIEDSFNGLSAGKNAGMFCIGYINPNSGNQDLSKADLIVNDIRDITLSKLANLL